ncbi:MAG: sulfur oxidation c-type cytochrome SoxX [Gallionellales bacterium RBG_16_56_9]|nr:MAG: sulfur oxidation c-type cytochrome SoxX [Gallionellales bacterium RBG_16_56_9]
MNRKLLVVALGATLLQGCSTAPAPIAPTTQGVVPARIEMNPKILVENSNLGNCLSCHAISKHPELVAGNIGPPWVAMKERFPDRSKLRAIIYDEQVNNPDTIMPPFGRNKILSAEQIDAVVDYILQF